ncbi:MAG: hypothetical protein APF77_03280 [Clostridia bacterium BRH_c25]|nr:MAG: hypothetical protein APF77_03280 [Clostridia bacterium BRH_c25]
MTKQTITVNNKTGLHARPASLLVTTALKCKSDITITKNGKNANAKSILSILSLGAAKGDSIVLTVNGIDEKEAAKKIMELFDSNFGE